MLQIHNEKRRNAKSSPLKRCLILALSIFLIPAIARSEFVDTLTNSGNANTNATNLQNAVNAAATRAGPTRIVLPAGATFSKTGAVTLTLINKTIDNAYTTIESSAISSMPTGQRVSPANAANMPKLLSSGANQLVVKTNASAHHYRFRGIEIGTATNENIVALMQLGDPSSAQDTLAEVPHHLEFDRCYMHAFSSTQAVRRAVALHSGHTIITNSYIAGCKDTGQADSQAIGGSNGTGPYYFVNNFLEAAGENVIIGGGATTIPGVIPQDVVIKRNHMFKPLSWRTTPATWSVKNLFEIKFGKRFDIDSNIFENSWVGEQEFAITIKVASNQEPSNPHSEMMVEDVNFTRNKVRHAAGAVVLQGRDWLMGRTPNMRRILVKNNVFEDISFVTYGATSGAGGSFLFSSGGPTEVTVENNTCFQDRYAIEFSEGLLYPQTNFIYRNNITAGNPQWNPDAHVHSDAGGVIGSAAFNAAPNKIFAKNVIMGVPTTTFTGTDLTNNWFPASWTGVLQNQAGGNYRVVVGSVYDNGGTDGKDIGADIDLVNAATQSCTTGNWTAKEVVLYASEASPRVGNWAVTSDVTAAGEASMRDSNANVATVTTPLASPAHYFEMNFNAEANVPYRLWIRGKADANDWASDSCWVQFDKSVNSSGAAIWRIGTTAAHMINIEDAYAGGLSGWGWQDDGYLADPGSIVYFSSGGTQKIRIQRREDGLAIDQIVLSPCMFFGGGPAQPSPGALKNDTTILQKTVAPIVQVTLKNGTNGYTSANSFGVRGQQPTVHHSSLSYFHEANNLAGANGFVLRSYYKFGLTPAQSGIPSGATIVSAKLRVKLEFRSHTFDYGISCHRMAPVTGFTVNYASATRNTYNGTNNWTGGLNAAGDIANSNNDYLDTPDSNIPIPATAGTWIEFDVTPSVQAFVNDSANNGWLVMTNPGATNITLRLSTVQDQHGAAENPELIVQYQ